MTDKNTPKAATATAIETIDIIDNLALIGNLIFLLIPTIIKYFFLKVHDEKNYIYDKVLKIFTDLSTNQRQIDYSFAQFLIKPKQFEVSSLLYELMHKLDAFLLLFSLNKTPRF